MIDIEVQGIPCVFNDEALSDFEMLEKLAALKDGDITALVAFSCGIFGMEQFGNIKESLRDENGVVQLLDVNNFVNQAVMAAAEVKRANEKN